MSMDENIALSLYDKMLQVVTGADPGLGLPSAFDTSTTAFLMAQRGLVLNGADYRNPWSPGNTSGSQESTANIASLVDDVPGPGPTWSPTLRRVSQVYSNLVQLVHVTEPPPSAEIEAARARAVAVLREEGKDDEGRAFMKPTQLADAEKKAYDAYTDAYTTYIGTWAAAMGDENLRRVWPLTGPTAVSKVRRAWQDWGSSGRDQVAAANAQLATLNESQVARVFEQAQWLLNAYQFTVETESQPILRSRIQPSDWAGADAFTWPEFTFRSSDFSSNHSTESTSWGASAGLNLGLWSFGGGVERSESREHLDTETKDISIKFRWRVCPITRPWMDATVFSLPNYDLGSLGGRGVVSDGAGGGLMARIPSALVIVRDVEVTGTWGRTDSDHIASATSGSLSVGYGPFSVSGNYSHSSTQDTYRAQAIANGFRIPDIQVIGVACTKVPLCPPKP
ncbi:hypothetical protein GTQ99_18355 [Kineococcus sp. T13]|uniref:hypothetical protein n=1 Tax=Kineococcus vitellinus TaxID=2696565 RepID=UPI00141366EB|nr:hypothetical protein [Kineococcus vitellinus]NAZ77368.1 hypothetical protein [Kineococcus vitellinus]